MNKVINIKSMARIILVLSLILYPLLAWSQDPWSIRTDQPLQGDYYGITSANGQIGLLSSRHPLQVDKVVVGELYDIYGSGRVNNFFPNINPLDILLQVNGMDIQPEAVVNYSQRLNFHNAAFSGSFTYADQLQTTYTIVALRHMPYGFLSDIHLVALTDIDLKVTNRHRVPDNLPEPHSCLSRCKNKANSFVKTHPTYYLLSTNAKSPSGQHDLAATTAFLFPDDIEQGTPYIPVYAEDSASRNNSMSFSCHLNEGDTLHFCLVGNILASNVVPQARNQAERLTLYQMTEGYNRLWQRHNDAWADLWQSDIIIEGDPQAQQDIRSMLYHHYAFYRTDQPSSCSPMGLSGLGYKGHVFWDSETWMFPVLLLMQPQMARQMLQYRYNRMNAARYNAYMHGYKGVMFPWESGETGFDETPLPNLYSELENHITADIACACWQYYCVTRDKQWLASVGYPLICQAADYWSSRVEPNGDIINVIGADEWNQNRYGGKQVNNNAYTIGVAKTALQNASRAAKVLRLKPSPDWEQVASKLHLTYGNDGVVVEHDSYDGAPTKQADVVLLAYPLHVLTDKQAVQRNLEYYISTVPEKRTPAMTKSIYATLYARLGMADKALYWWRDSYLPNLNPPFRVVAEFNGGTNPYFITGAGGTLQALLFGFAGLDITDKGLKQAYRPVLPKEWKSLTIRRQGYHDIVIK